MQHEETPEGVIYRTVFQHDRDKILYSPSFRRLRLKSQIFPEHVDDYLRTRLDHTLEVAQISRHLASQLKLNADLADAIALAHDIGHAPFAHSGERALHSFLRSKSQDGFKHNWQGLRVVDKLDRSYPEHNGLNLSRAVRIGILLHAGLTYADKAPCSCEMSNGLKESNGFDPTEDRVRIFEVQLVALADSIAASIHDFEDAIMSNTISLEEVVKKRGQWPLIDYCLKAIERRYSRLRRLPGWGTFEKFDFSDELAQTLFMARLRSETIYQLTYDAIHEARSKLDAWETKQLGESHELPSQVEKFNKFVESGSPIPRLISLGALKRRFEQHRESIGKLVVNSERVNRMDGKADYIIRKILEVYRTKPKQVPDGVLELYSRETGQDPAMVRSMSEMKIDKVAGSGEFIRAAVDFVASMSDRQALREYDRLYSAYPRAEI